MNHAKNFYCSRSRCLDAKLAKERTKLLKINFRFVVPGQQISSGAQANARIGDLHFMAFQAAEIARSSVVLMIDPDTGLWSDPKIMHACMWIQPDQKVAGEKMYATNSQVNESSS